VALTAVVVRLPLVLATKPFGYDDGVYASSVMAMRGGAVPFRDVFSSQGPVFLPTLRLFDMVGLDHSWAPRLAMLAASAVTAVALYSIALRVLPTVAAAAIGVAGATSAMMILAAGPLESDGLALAFATTALAVAFRKRGGPAVPVAVGVLGALALATKSLFAVPGVVAAVVVLLMKRTRRDAAVATAVGLLVGFCVTVPFGLGNVWDQYVLFHFRNPQSIDATKNALELVHMLTSAEIVVTGLTVVAALWWLRARRRPGADRALVVAGWTWLIGSAAVVIFTTDLNPGNHRYVAFVVVPLLVVVALARAPQWLVIGAVAVLLPFHIVGDASVLDGRELTAEETQLIAALENLPDGAQVESDIPSLTYAANLNSPSWLTDTSYARVKSGYLSADEAIAALANDDTCALLLWSGRLASLPADLADTATHLGYTNQADFGNGRTLLRRAICETKPDLEPGTGPAIAVASHNLD
jgi:hypothetical protein